MTSLLHLLRQTSPRRANLSLERTAAVILTKFESLWNKFVDSKGGFEPFLDDYLKLWLHRLVTHPYYSSLLHVVTRT
jgi:biotin--protein ligase